MHDKLKFGEGALENMVRLSGKTQEYLTRATQRYYGKTPMQIINDIRINLNIPAFFRISEPYFRERLHRISAYHAWLPRYFLTIAASRRQPALHDSGVNG